MASLEQAQTLMAAAYGKWPADDSPDPETAVDMAITALSTVAALLEDMQTHPPDGWDDQQARCDRINSLLDTARAELEGVVL
jgi:hypothetical protein